MDFSTNRNYPSDTNAYGKTACTKYVYRKEEEKKLFFFIEIKFLSSGMTKKKTPLFQ